MSPGAPRIGIIGARRVRQGLGPFVARHLRDAGADVCCFLATTEATRDATQRDLAERYGILARGYVDVAELVAEEKLDALAVLSPHETHGVYLETALDAGLHVLCDKPLLWGGDDLASTAQDLVNRFQGRGLVLWENCQWPYTLPAYAALHPAATQAVPRHFAMRMNPTALGAQVLADSLPHPLSMLQALAPGHEVTIEDATYAPATDQEREAVLRFTYRAAPHAIAVEVRLTPKLRAPRLTAYALDGCWVRRLIQMDDYALFFSDGLRVVPLDDPVALLARDFVQALGARPTDESRARTQQIVQRMQMLDYLAAALRERIV